MHRFKEAGLKYKRQQSTRRWGAYERGKAMILRRVMQSDKTGEAAARLYEAELKKLCQKLKI